MPGMIEFKRLQKVIDGNTVIDVDRLKVRVGEIVALVGPAGSGKRVLMDLLLGHAQPTAGTIRLAGVDPNQERDRFSRQVGSLCTPDAARKSALPLSSA
jgi:ABC-type multidrug transport system ATPase subunit